MKRKFWGLNYINMVAALMFAGIGVYLGRPGIVVISLAIFGLGLWTKKSFRKLASPDLALWYRFTKEHPELKKEKYITWHYGTNESDCTEWTEKVRKGEITGVSYFVPAFPHESNPQPKAGEYSIILDWSNKPTCIIKTVGTEMVPYKDITPEYVLLEGYNSVEKWQRVHAAKYADICEKLNIVFNEEMPILFEHFQLLYDVNHSEE
ncbi:MAG: ASCH domain-containing protein [Thiohalomonadaceae bacterium]